GRAVVIGPYRRQSGGASASGGSSARAGEPARGVAARLEEAVGLARAIELTVVHAGLVPLATVRPSTYLGKGKVEEIAGIVGSEEAALVVVDAPLSPVQQRNLEKAWNA